MKGTPMAACIVLSGLVFGSAGAEDPLPLGPGIYLGPGDQELPPGSHRFARDVHHQCGKYALVFRNPDLREDAEDFVHAQGQFFIQFQVVGRGSSEVTRLSFSFGKTNDPFTDTEAVNCNEAVPENQVGRGTGGGYLMHYRSDRDPRDGFFVPIKTQNVPDGEYAAAIHAYNAAGNEVARAWARAKVDNCPTDPNPPNACPSSDSPADILRKDRTKPWPMVLPGDGIQTNDVRGLTVEFGEFVNKTSVEVSLNAEPLAMTEWTPPARDNDVQPDNDHQPCSPNASTVCSREVYGNGFKWEGEVKEGDVIRVRAKDLAGNLVEKIVVYGSETSKGTVDATRPDLVILPLNGQEVNIRPGDRHEFNLRLDNVGAAKATVGLKLNVTEAPGWSVEWRDINGTLKQAIEVREGGQVPMKVVVRTATDTPETHYPFDVIVEYDVEGQSVQKQAFYLVDVNKEASPDHHHAHQRGFSTLDPFMTPSDSPTPTTRARTPAPAAILTLVAVLGALWRRRDP